MLKLARRMGLLLAWGVCLLAGGKLNGHARSEPQDHDLREACRKQIAGRYLVLYDGREKNQQLATYLAKKIKDLHAALATTAAALRQADAALAQAAFDAEHHAARIALEEKEKSLQAVLSSQEELYAKALVAAKEAQDELQEFEQRLRKLFKIETLSGRGVGYKFRVAYQGSCPPYRFSCPLSRDEAKVLRSMFAGDDLPKVCQKYADFLQW